MKREGSQIHAPLTTVLLRDGQSRFYHLEHILYSRGLPRVLSGIGCFT